MRYTVIRGVNGSTAASHPGGSDVTLMVTGVSAATTGTTSIQRPGDPPTRRTPRTTRAPTSARSRARGATMASASSVFTTGGSKDDLDIDQLAGEAGRLEVHRLVGAAVRRDPRRLRGQVREPAAVSSCSSGPTAGRPTAPRTSASGSSKNEVGPNADGTFSGTTPARRRPTGSPATPMTPAATS